MNRIGIQRFLLFCLALAVSGWGNLVAATNCPLMGFSPPPATREIAFQRVTKQPWHHCHQTAAPTPGTQSSPFRNDPKTDPDLFGRVPASFTSNTQCVLCVVRNEAPIRSAAKNEVSNSGSVLLADIPIGPFSLAKTSRHRILPRSNAPPGPGTATHLRLNVFLI